MRKLIAGLLIGALGLVSSAASCGGTVHDKAGQAIVAAEAAYHIVVEAELALRCGEPTALPLPNCISPEKHAQFKVILLQVFNPGPPPTGFLQDAKDLWAALPTEGSPNASQIYALISKIGEIVQRIISGLPQSTQATAAAKNADVVRTIKGIK
jgi:hypothetical protein